MTQQEAISALKQINLKRVHPFYDWEEMLEVRDIAIKALEKQIPKKPDTLTYRPLLLSGWKYQCPNCGCAVGKNKNLEFAYEEYLEAYQSNCMNCGQALDWSDTE